MMEDSQRDNCVNKEEEDKNSTSEKDCSISIEVTCDNDRNVAEAKAASVDDEQMQWTNCEAAKDSASITGTAESVQKMDVSPGKEQCRSVWFLRYIFGYPGVHVILFFMDILELPRVWNMSLRSVSMRL